MAPRRPLVHVRAAHRPPPLRGAHDPRHIPCRSNRHGRKVRHCLAAALGQPDLEGFAVAAAAPGPCVRKQVPDGLVVDLQARRLEGVLPPRSPHLRHARQDVLHASWDHAPLLPGPAHHRVRLARPRLPVGKQAHVVAVERALDVVLYFVEDVLLPRVRPKEPVELELAARPVEGHGHLARLFVEFQRAPSLVLRLPRCHRPQPPKDADVPPHLLQFVVQLSPRCLRCREAPIKLHRLFAQPLHLAPLLLKRCLRGSPSLLETVALHLQLAKKLKLLHMRELCLLLIHLEFRLHHSQPLRRLPTCPHSLLQLGAEGIGVAAGAIEAA